MADQQQPQGPPFFVNGVPVIMPPPPGYVVDFSNPERQYDVAAYATVAILNTFVLLFAGQRLWTRHVIQRIFEAEDFCFLMAWAFSTVIQILLVRCFATNILGVHSWEMPITEFFRFIKETLYLLPIMYAPVHLFAKMALLLFYKRLSPQTWFRWAVFGAMFVIIGSNVSIMIAAIFPCRPIRLAWDPSVPGQCIDRPALFQATAILGVLTDVVLLAIPIPMVLGLRMRTSNKVGLICIFAIGSVTIVTSIVRLVVLIQQLNVVDQSWGTAPAGYWIIIESNLSIICAALPTLRVFFTSTMPRWFGETGRASGGSGGPSGKKKGSGNSSKLSDGHGGPPTIGGTGGKRQKYSRFDDDAEFGLETLVKPGSVVANDDAVGGIEDVGGNGTGSGGAGNGRESAWDGRDADSEKGILQTRTTTVAYKDSRRPPGTKPPVNLGLPPV